ncbi:hypothetical protein MYX04_10870 [Nitrospiraceae bacterium AH_259_D15_M11_P09]|nr:hypothetical protein [Nitrospiraceae bacterium AH_259_D15_M11_P09]
MKRAIMVLTLSLIVGWTSAAAAECAWVLWKHIIAFEDVEDGVRSPNASWELEDAFDDREVCISSAQTAMGRDIEFWKRQGAAIEKDEDELAGFTVRMKIGEQKVVSIRTLRCFPDTIDPRERKD